MGKIVKYCSSCDEGFAEKFGFCPDCGAPLQAFEMSPVENEFEMVSAEPEPVEAEIDATPVEIEPEAPAPVFLQADDESIEEEEIEEPVEEETFVATPATAPVFYQTASAYADEQSRHSLDEDTNWDYTHPDDGGFYVTVIEEKNGKQRNGLLLGAAVLVLFLSVGGWGVSLFQKDLGIGAIGDETSLAYLGVDVPMPVEVEEKKDKDEGGGGGGGGREDKEETSQGDLADQSRTPTHIRPDVSIVKNDNFELKQPIATTEGDKKFPKIYDRYGDPNSKFAGLSNGPGFGGGQGSGNGNGQGSGNGSGAGSGSGSGYGNGNGNGNGDGDGDGNGRNGPPPAAIAKTTPLKITFQPKATYTDEARSANVQGAVRLKITLLASGQVGSIVPLTRLPNGLTEKAIAAARMIRFEPKTVNGVPITVNITREYTFTIY